MHRTLISEQYLEPPFIEAKSSRTLAIKDVNNIESKLEDSLDKEYPNFEIDVDIAADTVEGVDLLLNIR